MVKRENEMIDVPPTEIRYRGVSKRPSGRYSAKITVPIHQTHVWLGTFDTPEQAARAYDKAARHYRGPKTITNFPAINEENLENANNCAEKLNPNMTSVSDANNNNLNQSNNFAPPRTALEKFYLEVLRRGRLISRDPTNYIQKEIGNFIRGNDSGGGVQYQPPTTNAEPLNLELTLAQPGSM